MRTSISHKEYSQTMPRDCVCPERPSVSRDPCTIRAPRSTGTPTKGDAIVKGGARKLCLTLSSRSKLKVLADDLLPTRFGWQHKSPWWYSDAKRERLSCQLTQSLSATYLAKPLIEVRSIPHRTLISHNKAIVIFNSTHTQQCSKFSTCSAFSTNNIMA